MNKIFFILLFIPFSIFGQLAGTVHDFGGDDRCNICHDGRLRSTLFYNLYWSPTLDAYLMQPMEGSIECLDCHNGGNLKITMGQSTNFGTDLSNHHPISFIYDNALVLRDSELHEVIRVSKFLKDGRVECVSCHDVHGSGYPNLLKMSNQGSALCLSCHKK